jgi:hypothetical protein
MPHLWDKFGQISRELHAADNCLQVWKAVSGHAAVCMLLVLSFTLG